MSVANSRFAVASAITKIAERVYAVDTGAPADFTGIPQTYRHLFVVFKVRTFANGSSTITFNGDNGANYDTQLLQGAAAAAAALEGLGGAAGNVGATAGAAGEGTTGTIFIGFYADPTLNKQAMAHVGYSNGILSGNTQVRGDTTHWRNTAAINRVTITGAGGGFRAGSILSLYGLT